MELDRKNGPIGGLSRAEEADYSTLAGIAAAIVMIAVAVVAGGNIGAFFDFSSFLIVIGGTLAVTTACFSIGEMLQMRKLLVKTVFNDIGDPTRVAVRAIEVAEQAKKKGILGLQERESMFESLGPSFARAIRMLIDGLQVEEVEKVIQQDISSTLARHNKGSAILIKAAETAPAMGLIGTLIGLVQMLGNINDPSNIGPSMAIALLTTLYGAMFAYMVLLPLASKLERNSNEESMVLRIHLSTISSVGRQENPRRLETMLNTILPPGKRIHYFS